MRGSVDTGMETNGCGYHLMALRCLQATRIRRVTEQLVHRLFVLRKIVEMEKTA